MKARDIVNDTGIAAFVRGPEGSITGWNAAMEELLKLEANDAVGRPCHRVLEGTDELGSYCCRQCPSWRAATGGRQIRPYRLRVTTGRGRRVDVTVMILVATDADGLSLVHLLEPVDEPGAVVALWDDMESMGLGDGFGYTDRHRARELTFRELGIVHELAIGRDAPAIASRLAIERAAVWRHITSCVRKLGTRPRMH